MRKLKHLSALLALTLVLVGCSGGAGGNKDTAGGGGSDGKRDTLTIAMSQEPNTIDPINQNSIYAERVMYQIYDGLVTRLPDGTLENRLAESIDQPDEVTYDIKLREGVKFSDGSDFTSEDVKYTLDRAAKSEGFNYIYGKIDPNSYDTTDPNRIIFKLTEPVGSFEEALANPAVLITSKDADEGSFDTAPVGTGPFTLENWNKLDTIELVKNENYWGEAPDFDKMVFRIIPESNSRMIELESGQVDLAMEIAPSDLKKVEDNDDLTLNRVMDNSVHFIGLNMTKAPFDNPEARKALNYAIDKQAIVDTILEGTGKVATGPINPNFEYSISDELEPTKVDTEKAKEMLKEAGVPEGTTLKFYVSDDSNRIDTATVVQAQLAEVGLNVEITSLEWGTYVEALENKEHDMFIMSWTPSVVDPHYALFGPYHSKNQGVGPNYMFYGNPELDALIDKGVGLPNGDERAEVYKQAQEIVLEDAPMIYLYYGEQLVGTQNYVKNYDINPAGSGEFYHIHLND